MAGYITGAEVKTLLSNFKGNSGNLTDPQLIDWLNFLNQFLYEKFASVQPERYLNTSVIKPILGKSSYPQPSDFKDQQLGGIYLTFSGSDYLALNFDTQTVAFVAGGVLTGAISGATATISTVTQYTTSGTLQLSAFSGEFEDNEIITGSLGGSATVNGTQFPFSYSPKTLPKTNFGDQKLGFWFSNNNIELTPNPQTLFVLVQRYLPRLAKITNLNEELIIQTPEYDEFMRNSADVFWSQWRQDFAGEITSSQRAEQALSDMLSDFENTPSVIDMPSSRNTYRGLARGQNGWNGGYWWSGS